MQKICKVCGKTSGGLVPPANYPVTDDLDWAISAEDNYWITGADFKL
jgi:hypothetical protein